MALTKSQREHALNRVTDILENKQSAELLRRLGERPGGNVSTFYSRYQEIAAGRAKLKPFESVNSCTDLEDAYTYPALGKRAKAIEAAQKKWDEKAAPINAKYEALKNQYRDKVILCGETEVLGLFATLENL